MSDASLLLTGIGIGFALGVIASAKWFIDGVMASVEEAARGDDRE